MSYHTSENGLKFIRADRHYLPKLRRVINATGIVIPLGRAPLHPSSMETFQISFLAIPMRNQLVLEKGRRLSGIQEDM